jgi:hypothetical protein
MRHPKAESWEHRLKRVFDKVNDHLEVTYGHLYPLHPARPPHRTTSSPEADGLFDVGGVFTAGFGSSHGPGYIVEIRFVTLSHVPADVRHKIQEDAISRLRKELPQAFPGRILKIERDGPVYKIVGDLSLGVA